MSIDWADDARGKGLLTGLLFGSATQEVLRRTREQLMRGASQIKIMAGGGTSSAYDPVDVTQYTLDEMRAAVDAHFSAIEKSDARVGQSAKPSWCFDVITA